MRVFLHHNRWYFLVACLLFFAARWAFTHARMERLRDLPEDEMLAIRNGAIYFRVRHPETIQAVATKEIKPQEQTAAKWQITPPPLTLQKSSVTGGSPRLLGEDKSHQKFYVAPVVSEAGISYLAFTPDKSRTFPARLTPPRLRRGDRMLTYIEAELLTFPFSGNRSSPAFPKRVVHTIYQSAYTQFPYAIVGETVYWLEADLLPDLIPRHARRNAEGQIIEAPLRLLMAPLRGGPARCVLDGLPKETGLHATAGAVWWSLPNRDEPEHYDIYCLRADEAKPRLILKNSLTRDLPLEVGGRLYWRRERSHDSAGHNSSAPVEATHSQILSTALDGSDSQVVYADTRSPFLLSLHAHAGRLYFSQVEPYGSRTDTSSLRPALYRLSLDTPGRAERILTFPRDSILRQFSDGYVYFTIAEQRENPFDWSREGLIPTYVSVLYRSRLPD